MTDMTAFEAQLERRLRAHAAPAADRPFDALVIAQAAAQTRHRRVVWRLEAPAFPRLLSVRIGVALMIVAVTMALVVVGAALLQAPTRPLGGMLAIGSRDGLAVAEPDGSNPRQVRADGPYFQPRWSVTGRYIATSTITDADANLLRVFSPDGILVREIPRVFDYRWSPVRDELLINVVGPIDAVVISNTLAPLEAGDHGVAIVPMPGVAASAGTPGDVSVLVSRLESDTGGQVAQAGIGPVAWASDGSTVIAFSPSGNREPLAWSTTLRPDGFSGGMIEGWPAAVTSAAFAHRDDRLAVIATQCPTDARPDPCPARLALVASTEGGVARPAIALSGEATTGGRIAWSPDDRQILFDVGGDIALAAADASRVTRLTSDAATDSVVGWSPDGRRILFLRQRPVGGPAGTALDLWAMHPDGSNQRRLAAETFGADEGPSSQPPTPTPTPSPRPAGEQAILVRAGDDTPDGDVDVVAVGPWGEERVVRRLAASTLPDGRRFLAFGDVSRDGWLAVHTEIGSTNDGSAAFALYDLADPTRGPRFVPYQPGIGGAWGPDGLFVTTLASTHGLQIVDARDGTTRTLEDVPLPGGGPYLIWAADGSGLLVIDGGGRLAIQPIDGGSPIRGVPALAPSPESIVYGLDGTTIGVYDGAVSATELAGPQTTWYDGDLVGAGTPSDAKYAGDGRSVWLLLDQKTDAGRFATLAHADRPHHWRVVGTLDVSLDVDLIWIRGVAHDDSAIVIGIDKGNPDAGLAVQLIRTDDGRATPHDGNFIGFVPEDVTETWP